jgi:hypothetical protein
MHLLLLGIALFSTPLGCGMAPEPTVVQVAEVTTKAACGMCQYHLDGAHTCFWAVTVDGQKWPVNNMDGVQPPEDHDAHGSDGMCVMERDVVVAGRIKGGVFTASKFDLQPAENVGEHRAHDHVH